MLSVVVLLLAAVSSAKCEELTQPDDLTLRSGEEMNIACQVSYSLGSHHTSWFRQPAGKGLEWIGHRRDGWNDFHKESLQNKFSIELNPSSQTVTLNGKNMQPQDSAVYYCARDPQQHKPHCDYGFDYWGKGTKVTVTGGTPVGPSVFPLIQCGSGDAFSLGCLATGFSPSPLTFSWSKDGTVWPNVIQYPSVDNNRIYTGVSRIQVTKADWADRAKFRCVAEHSAGDVPVTFDKPEEALYQLPTLKVLGPPDASNEASFACFAKDFTQNVFNFTWLRNENSVTGKIDEMRNEARKGASGSTLYSAASFLTLRPDQWLLDTNITCQFKGKSAQGDVVVTSSIIHQCSSADVDIQITGPTLEEMFLHQKGTVTCQVKVRQPVVKDISWENQDGKNMAGTSVSIPINATGVYRTLLDITYDEWRKGIRRDCVVVRSDGKEPVKKSYERQTGKRPQRPTLFMMAPVEHSRTDTVTLTCFAKNFYPREVLLSWLVDDEPVNSTYVHSTTAPVENGGSYSVYGQLTLSLEQWQRFDVVYSCVLYHESLAATANVIVRTVTYTSAKTATANFSMGDPELCATYVKSKTAKNERQHVLEFQVPAAATTAPPNVTPEMTLYPLWEDKSGAPKVKLLCLISGAFPSKTSVQWLRDGQKVAAAQTGTFQPAVGGAKTFTLISKMEPSEREWKSGSSFTCRWIGGDEEMQRSISICETQANSAPSIHVELPSFKAVMTEGSRAKALCRVRTALGAAVTLLAEGAGAAREQPGRRNASHVVSVLTVSPDQWKQMKRVTCKVEHRCFSAIEESVPVAESAVVKPPSVVVRRSLADLQTEDGAVFECDITQLDPVDLYVSLQADGVDVSDKRFVALSEAPSRRSISPRFSLPKSLTKKDVRLTCKVNQGFSGIFESKPLDAIFAGPSAELFLATGQESKSQRLLCSGWGFKPQITWLSGSEERPPSRTSDFSMSADGRVAVASQLDVDREEWQSGKRFTCQVSDAWLEKTSTSAVDFCSVTPSRAQKVAVYVQGPPLTESPQSDHVDVTCLLVGVHLEHFSISWKVDGKEYLHNSHTETPTVHDNGTETLRSSLRVLTGDWEAYKQVSCQGTHKCSERGYEARVSKSKDWNPPTVRIVPPSISELTTSGDLTLTCLVSGFSPDDKIVYWEKDGQRVPPGSYANGPSWKYGSTFSMSSTLTVSKSEDRGSTYSCRVRHESSKTPFRSTIDDVFAAVTPSRPSAILLRGSGELVCLVFGFSPPAINVSWFLDAAAELPYFNTSQPSRGPDGKFSVRSRLRLTPVDLLPGAVHTCRVTHATLTLNLNVTNPVILPDCNVLDDIADAVVNQDINVESWYMSATFLVLFLISSIYSVLATLVKTK
ncbi:uncharacterized protein [Syngnathus scovelli]|uniref:uncharacterized protein n=1 Tax=Syngnathus scovelli TaxID=161590 RepID=UPI0035CBCD0D